MVVILDGLVVLALGLVILGTLTVAALTLGLEVLVAVGTGVTTFLVGVGDPCRIFGALGEGAVVHCHVLLMNAQAWPSLAAS